MLLNTLRESSVLAIASKRVFPGGRLACPLQPVLPSQKEGYAFRPRVSSALAGQILRGVAHASGCTRPWTPQDDLI